MIRTMSTCAAMCLMACSAGAQERSNPNAVVNPEVGLPVFPDDINDRPYTVLGEVKAGVRKATLFSDAPSRRKIYAELWERARKLGADAVIKARYGKAHISAFSWGKANATGVAIRFLPQARATHAVP